METHKKGKRILKKLGGYGQITQKFKLMTIKNTIEDMFLNYYYNMKKIIIDIHNYINEKEEKEITLTDDDIINMIKIHKTNLIMQVYNEGYNGGLKNFDGSTGREQELYKSTIEKRIGPKTFYIEDPLKYNITLNKLTYHTDDGNLYSNPYFHYNILGNLFTANDENGQQWLTKEEVDKFLEIIYQIYKTNEKDYETYFF